MFRELVKSAFSCVARCDLLAIHVAEPEPQGETYFFCWSKSRICESCFFNLHYISDRNGVARGGLVNFSSRSRINMLRFRNTMHATDLKISFVLCHLLIHIN
jgi:hypothetical protein